MPIRIFSPVVNHKAVKWTKSILEVLSLTLAFVFLACQSVHKQPGETSAAPLSGHPNIVMIVVDDQRWDELSIAGHPFLKTPNMDRLAREGILFRNAYQVVPLCSPNRASILTGQYPSRHGIVDNVARDRASHRLQLFAPLLQQAGYTTAHIGKWHMGNDPTPRPGYDYWTCLPGQGRTIDPILYEDGRLDTISGYVTDILTDKMIEFIRNNASKPFFAYLGHKAVHPDAKQLNNGAIDLKAGHRFIPAPRHEGTYHDAFFQRRPNALTSYDQVDSASVIGQALIEKSRPTIRNEFGDDLLDHFTTDKTIRERSEMLLAVDESLGKIMAALEALNILDNTCIILTSDNGYFYGEHGLSLERRLPYEESVRTPLIIRYPGAISHPGQDDHFTLSIDYAPTILDLAGIAIPAWMQGRSLVPLMQGPVKDWRQSFLMEYYSYENPMPWLIDTDYKALRKGNYKYIRWYKYQDRDELYDLESDPYEMHNLVHEPNMKSLASEMKTELAQAAAEAMGLN